MIMSSSRIGNIIGGNLSPINLRRFESRPAHAPSHPLPNLKLVSAKKNLNQYLIHQESELGVPTFISINVSSKRSLNLNTIRS